MNLGQFPYEPKAQELEQGLGDQLLRFPAASSWNWNVLSYTRELLLHPDSAGLCDSWHFDYTKTSHHLENSFQSSEFVVPYMVIDSCWTRP